MNIVIDTNALISFVTDRNPAQQSKVAEILERAARLELTILCPQNVITEFVYVLERVYEIRPALIKQMIYDLLEMPGVEIVHQLDLTTLLSYWPERIPEYGDAILACVAFSRDAMVFTFDNKFRRKLEKIHIQVYTQG